MAWTDDLAAAIIARDAAQAVLDSYNAKLPAIQAMYDQARLDYLPSISPMVPDASMMAALILAASDPATVPMAIMGDSPTPGAATALSDVKNYKEIMAAILDQVAAAQTGLNTKIGAVFMAIADGTSGEADRLATVVSPRSVSYWEAMTPLRAITGLNGVAGCRDAVSGQLMQASTYTIAADEQSAESQQAALAAWLQWAIDLQTNANAPSPFAGIV